jgi:hypothetical protein
VIDVIIGLPLVAIVAFGLGSGWACVLRKASPAGTLGFIFLAWACSIVVTSVVWAAAYPANLDVRWGLGLTFLVAAVGYVVALWTHSFEHHAVRWRELGGLLVPVCVALIALIPAFYSSTQLSVGLRVGPDAIGYAISARAIEDGLTRSTMDHQLLAEVGGGTVQNALSPDTRLADSTPSLDTQVQAEFFEGADRWGFGGAAGSVLYLIGADHLWSVLSLLAAFGLLTACLGVWVIVRRVGGPPWAALVATALLGLNTSVLNSWHEGGLAQIWILPACVLLASSLATLGTGSRIGGAVGVGLGVACIAPAYNEALITYGILFAIVMVLSVPMLGRRWWHDWWPLLTGAAAGALLVIVSTAAFLSTLARSLHENGTAGWPQPRWIGPAEAFSLYNSYGNDAPVIGRRSGWEPAVVGGEDLGLLLLLASLAYSKLLRPAVILLGAVVVVAGGIYVKTRYLDHTTNYQYFKTIAMICPAGSVAVGLLLGEALNPRTLPNGEAARRRHVKRSSAMDVITITLSGLMLLAVLASAVSYVVSYRIEGTVVPMSYSGLATSTMAQATLQHFNLLAAVAGAPPRVAEARLEALALGAEANVNLVGRNPGQPRTRLVGRVEDPVALVVLEADCPRFSCLEGIPSSRVPYHDNGVALVQLSGDSTALMRMAQSEWYEWAASRYYAIGGGRLEGLVPAARGG